MYEKWQKIFRPEASLFMGVLFVGLLGFLRPYQKDFSHVVGILTMGGGRAFHPAHLEMGKDLFGQNTIFVSADVIPPIKGDIHVKLVGPESLDYTVSSRYPPVVPLFNGTHAWYRFEDNTLKGVHPGDDLGVVVTVDPPASPGEYQLIMANAQTGQPYMTVPVLFEQPGAAEHDTAIPAGASESPPADAEEEPTEGSVEPCH
jgi:hypothetical protein